LHEASQLAHQFLTSRTYLYFSSALCVLSKSHYLETLKYWKFKCYMTQSGSVLKSCPHSNMASRTNKRKSSDMRPEFSFADCEKYYEKSETPMTRVSCHVSTDKSKSEGHGSDSTLRALSSLTKSCSCGAKFHKASKQKRSCSFARIETTFETRYYECDILNNREDESRTYGVSLTKAICQESNHESEESYGSNEESIRRCLALLTDTCTCGAKWHESIPE